MDRTDSAFRTPAPHAVEKEEGQSSDASWYAQYPWLKKPPAPRNGKAPRFTPAQVVDLMHRAIQGEALRNILREHKTSLKVLAAFGITPATIAAARTETGIVPQKRQGKKYSPPPRFTREQIDTLMQRAVAGESIQSLVRSEKTSSRMLARLGITPEAVLAKRERQNVTVPKKQKQYPRGIRFTPEQIAEFKERMAKGVPISTLARSLNSDPRTLLKYASGKAVFAVQETTSRPANSKPPAPQKAVLPATAAETKNQIETAHKSVPVSETPLPKITGPVASDAPKPAGSAKAAVEVTRRKPSGKPATLHISAAPQIQQPGPRSANDRKLPAALGKLFPRFGKAMQQRGVTDIEGIINGVPESVRGNPADLLGKLQELVSSCTGHNERGDPKLIVKMLEAGFGKDLFERNPAAQAAYEMQQRQIGFSKLLHAHASFDAILHRVGKAKGAPAHSRHTRGKSVPVLKPNRVEAYRQLYTGHTMPYVDGIFSSDAAFLIARLDIPSKDVLQAIPDMRDEFLFFDAVRQHVPVISAAMCKHDLYTVTALGRKTSQPVAPAQARALVNLFRAGSTQLFEEATDLHPLLEQAFELKPGGLLHPVTPKKPAGQAGIQKNNDVSPS